jgi:hypothetical protein
LSAERTAVSDPSIPLRGCTGSGSWSRRSGSVMASVPVQTGPVWSLLVKAHLVRAGALGLWAGLGWPGAAAGVVSLRCIQRSLTVAARCRLSFPRRDSHGGSDTADLYCYRLVCRRVEYIRPLQGGAMGAWQAEALALYVACGEGRNHTGEEPGTPKEAGRFISADRRRRRCASPHGRARRYRWPGCPR